MHKKWLIGGGLALVLGIGGALAWVSGAIPSQAGQKLDKAGDKAAAALSFAPREVVRPQQGPMPGRIEFSGPLVAPGTAVLKAKAAGTLINLAAAEGDRVRAGQQMGRLDLADASSRVAERSANVAAARAVLAQAERSHAQNQRLAAQQFISTAALDSSRSAVETAQAQLNAAIASADLARVGLRDATLVAPIDGIVARRHVLPGEKVSPEQPVLTLVDLRRLELAGVVGTHEVSRLSVDMPVSVQVEGMDRPVDGRIARIAPAAEPGTRSIGVTIVLDNPKETLRAGQYAVASATLADDLQRLSVPVAAVAQTSGQDHVWVIDDGVLARRAVRLGRRDARGARVEILSGLAPDSVVLAARFDKLVEGAKASVLVDKISAVASAAASAPLQ
jgi:membrane fusion protein (multidrug efflux system)